MFIWNILEYLNWKWNYLYVILYKIFLWIFWWWFNNNINNNNTIQNLVTAGEYFDIFIWIFDYDLVIFTTKGIFSYFCLFGFLFLCSFIRVCCGCIGLLLSVFCFVFLFFVLFFISLTTAAYYLWIIYLWYLLNIKWKHNVIFW